MVDASKIVILAVILRDALHVMQAIITMEIFVINVMIIVLHAKARPLIAHDVMMDISSKKKIIHVENALNIVKNVQQQNVKYAMMVFILKHPLNVHNVDRTVFIVLVQIHARNVKEAFIQMMKVEPVRNVQITVMNVYQTQIVQIVHQSFIQIMVYANSVQMSVKNVLDLQKMTALIVMKDTTSLDQIEDASNAMKDVLTALDQMTMNVQLVPLDIS